VPAKKTASLTDVDRAKRMRELAREAGADNDPATLDRALGKIAERRPEPMKAGESKKRSPAGYVF
jgi:hypothetical protein